MTDFEQIEDKIIDTLKTNLTYVRTIETYAGQLEGVIDELLINYPVIFVMYAGSQYEWVDGQQNFNEVDIFTILLAAKNHRGNKAMRKDQAEGCYKLIKDVLTKITNQDFGLDIEKMQPQNTKLIIATKTTTIYGVDFKTNFDKAY